MEHTYVALDEAGTIVIFGFHDKLTDMKTRVTLDAHEAYQLSQRLSDYHRNFLQAMVQQKDRGEAAPS